MLHVRELEDCRAATSGFGFERQLSAESLREQMREECSESHALPRSFGSKERFGDALENFGSHADSFVSDDESDALRIRFHRLQ